MTSVKTVEGEQIERKVERLVHNNEPIKDGAPEIFTERKDGVIHAYNIRTDRWEIAADAMDAVSRSIEAKRAGTMGKIGGEDAVDAALDGDVGGAKSTADKGTSGASTTN